jgi:hypothetical protein
MAISPPIPTAEMGTDAARGRSGIGSIAIVQDHRLDVTIDRLDRIVIGAGSGQADRVQRQRPHDPPCLPRLPRMRPILVQGDPDVLLRVPMSHPCHEPADLSGALRSRDRPGAMHLTGGDHASYHALRSIDDTT